MQFDQLFLVAFFFAGRSSNRCTGLQESLSIFIEPVEMSSKRPTKLTAILDCQDVIDKSSYVFNLSW